MQRLTFSLAGLAEAGGLHFEVGIGEPKIWARTHGDG